MTLRPVALPFSMQGALYLHNMPARPRYGRSLADDAALMAENAITYAVDLAPLSEARTKSPDYAAAVESGTLTWNRVSFPVTDLRVPVGEERPAYLDLARKIASDLKAGARVVIHCGAGIGRSGTLAIAVLLAAGSTYGAATGAVAQARGYPETGEQRDLLAWIEHECSSPSAKELE
jgi:protein-tyrosine phosphatase